MTNPLLETHGLPRFDAVLPEHVAPAVEALLAENRALVARLESDTAPPDWDNFVAPMIDAGERFGRAWGVVGHLHGVMDTPAWREAYNALLPEVSRYYAALGQNLKLFSRYRQLRDSDAFPRLSAVRQRIVDNEVRDFRLSGAELPEEQKPRFQAIAEEQASLAAKFSENVLDATNCMPSTSAMKRCSKASRKTPSLPRAPSPKRRARMAGFLRCICHRTCR